jgi:hypothetical protein
MAKSSLEKLSSVLNKPNAPQWFEGSELDKLCTEYKQRTEKKRNRFGTTLSGIELGSCGNEGCCGMEAGADHPPRSSRFLAYTQNMMSPVLQEKDVEKANRTRPGLEPGSWLIFGKELLQIRLESLVCGC